MPNTSILFLLYKFGSFCAHCCVAYSLLNVIDTFSGSACEATSFCFRRSRSCWTRKHHSSTYFYSANWLSGQSVGLQHSLKYTPCKNIFRHLGAFLEDKCMAAPFLGQQFHGTFHKHFIEAAKLPSRVSVKFTATVC